MKIKLLNGKIIDASWRIKFGRFCIRRSLSETQKWELDLEPGWPALYLGPIVIEIRPKNPAKHILETRFNQYE